jgi:transposase
LIISRPALFRWVKWYNEKGLERIRDVSSGGRPEGNPKWDNSIFDALFAKLDAMEEFFSVPKMQVWIEETYGKKIPERTIHDRLRVGGYSFKSSRPNPYKGDPNLQAQFKKTEL